MSQQLEFFDVPSPCIGICQSDEKGYCKGCKRTREERLNWNDFSSDEKQKVIKRCVQRKKRAQQSEQKSPKPLEPDVSKQAVQRSIFDPIEVVQVDTSIDDNDFEDFEL